VGPRHRSRGPGAPGPCPVVEGVWQALGGGGAGAGVAIYFLWQRGNTAAKERSELRDRVVTLEAEKKPLAEKVEELCRVLENLRKSVDDKFTHIIERLPHRP
jgi:hypothetical protein